MPNILFTEKPAFSVAQFAENANADRDKDLIPF